MFDLTVMDFARWGMGGAVPRFRDTAEDGFNLMDRLCDKPEWTTPEPGREHHKRWYQMVTHPDARLMEAAPDLLSALKEVVRVIESNPPSITDTVWVTGNSPETLYDHCLAAIAKAEGGKA